MLAVDLALLAGGALLVMALAAVVGGRVGPRMAARRRRLQGERNAAAERQRADERCAACDAAIDPETDVFDAGRWWHRACFRDLLH